MKLGEDIIGTSVVPPFFKVGNGDDVGVRSESVV